MVTWTNVGDIVLGEIDKIWKIICMTTYMFACIYRWNIKMLEHSTIQRIITKSGELKKWDNKVK